MPMVDLLTLLLKDLPSSHLNSYIGTQTENYEAWELFHSLVTLIKEPGAPINYLLFSQLRANFQHNKYLILSAASMNYST